MRTRFLSIFLPDITHVIMKVIGTFILEGEDMKVNGALDFDIRCKMADEVANELDRTSIDWEHDDEMMEYYVAAMKRIWGEGA